MDVFSKAMGTYSCGGKRTLNKEKSNNGDYCYSTLVVWCSGVVVLTLVSKAALTSDENEAAFQQQQQQQQ